MLVRGESEFRSDKIGIRSLFSLSERIFSGEPMSTAGSSPRIKSEGMLRRKMLDVPRRLRRTPIRLGRSLRRSPPSLNKIRRSGQATTAPASISDAISKPAMRFQNIIRSALTAKFKWLSHKIESVASGNFHSAARPCTPAGHILLVIAASLDSNREIISEFSITPFQVRKR
jgi:hypothetical protein